MSLTIERSSDGDRISVGANTTERLYADILLMVLISSTLWVGGGGGG